MGACEGVKDWDCEGGHKFTGPGTRRWSCWVRDMEGELKNYEKAMGNKTQVVEDAMFTSTEVVTGAMASSSMVGAFTAGVTGS